jgi:HTH-type transcriptional regulator/antitoxin HipB
MSPKDDILRVHTMLLRSPTDLGAAIKDRRRRLGLNQAQLAARIGTSRQWVIDIEKGRKGTEIGLVFRALNVLGLALQIADNPPRKGGKPDVDIDDIVAGARKPTK